MVGKKSGRALLREEGLERTDNNMDLTTWPQVNMINQKNYYTEYLKRDDQILALRLQNEEARNRMTKEARDRDRAMAQGTLRADGDVDVDDAPVGDDAADVAGSKVIVIHPGSQNLRIGLGTDALPKTLPMVIARKAKETEEGGPAIPERLLDEDGEPLDPEKQFGDEFANNFNNMCSELKAYMRNNRRRILPNSKELVVNWNRKHRPDIIPEHNDPNRVDWTELPPDTRKAPEYFTGLAALRIPEQSRPTYKLTWPLRYGWLNEKDYVSKKLLYQDVATIIEDAVRTQIGIQRKRDWAQYSCVFIIPDLYERTYVTSMMELLLRDLGFGRVCFMQESLAASFGAGTSISCIVDIGAQKTSICCVDEGMCIENSRVNIKYGGADVTEAFIKMMLFDWFPYSDINLKRRYDLLLADELKQKFCTMDDSGISVQQYEFHLRAPNQDTRRYNFKTYDEVMTAPMGFFKPTIFDNSRKLEGRRKLIDRSYDLYDGSPNDPISAAQMTVLQASGALTSANSVNGTAGSSDPPGSVAPGATPLRPSALQSLAARFNEYEGTPRSSVAGSPGPDGAGTPLPGKPDDAGADPTTGPTFDANAEKVAQAEERDRILPIMPLDHAIIASISQGARGDERKMRDFFGGIMVIGGGGKFPAFNQFLEERLRALQPGFLKEILIGPPPREMDPAVVVWKGGSVFGKLSNSNDSWIGQLEYDRLGSRVLAYKLMWSW